MLTIYSYNNEQYFDPKKHHFLVKHISCTSPPPPAAVPSHADLLIDPLRLDHLEVTMRMRMLRNEHWLTKLILAS